MQGHSFQCVNSLHYFQFHRGRFIYIAQQTTLKLIVHLVGSISTQCVSRWSGSKCLVNENVIQKRNLSLHSSFKIPHPKKNLLGLDRDLDLDVNLGWSRYHPWNFFCHRFTTESQSHPMALSRSGSKKTVVCVEGNIGCGKTTLLNYFEGLQNCEVVAEPVERWRNIEGYNALGLMYKDPERWGMALQTYIQLTMLQIHNKQQETGVRLMERSIFSAKYCFTDNLYDSGKMPGVEHVILTKWFDWIIATQNIKVDLIVYLRTSPEVLHRRILRRCRKEEEGIPVVLLKALHQKYEDWLIHKKHPCPAEVLIIDANQTLEEMEESYETHKSKILVSQAVK